MKKRRLGKTGVEVPEMGMGCWAIGGVGYGPVSEPDALATLEAAWESGVRFFDTADTYGEGRSESFVGQFLKSKPRGEAVIATKAGVDFYPAALWQKSSTQAVATGHKKNFRPDYIQFACEQSLKRLGVEYIDFYQLHNPNLETLKKSETFETVLKLKQAGKIRFAGLSLHTVDEALWALEHLPVDSLQLIYNILDQRMRLKVFPLAQKKGVAVIVREPLASGLLTGKYDSRVEFAKDDHRRRFSREKLAADCQKMDRIKDLLAPRTTDHEPRIHLSQAALQFVLAEDAVSAVIPGAKCAEQAKQNSQAATECALDKEAIEKLQRLFELDPLFRRHLLPA